MSDPREYKQVSGSVLIDDDNGRAELVANPGTDTYIYIENLTISVVDAALGGGGVVELRDGDGGFFYKTNTDGIKDILVIQGAFPGPKIGPNLALEAVVYGAQTRQASVSIIFNGHITTKYE